VQNYVNDQPRYISAPDTSHVRVLSYADYKLMSVEAVQSLHRDRHLAITDFPTEQVVPTDQVDFDEAGLQLLTNLEAPIEFQGKLSESSCPDKNFPHISVSSLQTSRSCLMMTTWCRSAQERWSTFLQAHEKVVNTQRIIISSTIKRDPKICIQQ